MLLVSSCGTTIPNTTYCSSLTSILQGASCNDTLRENPKRLTYEEWVEFIEPREAYINEQGVEVPFRAGAVCQSAYDFNKQKTALEEICRRAGNKCTYEIQEAIKSAAGRVEKLHFRK